MECSPHPRKAGTKTSKPLVLTREAQKDKFLERKRLTKKQDVTKADAHCAKCVGQIGLS